MAQSQKEKHSTLFILLFLTSIIAHGILYTSKNAVFISNESPKGFYRSMSSSSDEEWDFEDSTDNIYETIPSVWESKTNHLRSPKTSYEKLPHWRLATDCSSYSFDCFAVAQREDKYKPYPFLESTRTEIESEESPDWSVQVFDEFPEDWIQYLDQSKPTTETTIEEKNFLYPPQVSPEEYQQCVETAIHQNKSTMEQLDVLFSTGTISPEPETNMVAFTISDYGYVQDMLHDVFQMMDDVVGFSNKHFFLVALDDKSAELACRYGYSVVTWKADGDNLRDAVANTKVVLSHEFVKRGIDFFFTEMDVWWIRSPKPQLVDFSNKHHVDDHNHNGKHIYFSGHQNNYGAPNIGVYAVKADDYSLEYFRICLDVLKEKPETHDQWVMAEVHRLFSHTLENRDYKLGGNFKPDGPPETPKVEHPFKARFFSPHEVVADERPTTTQLTLAIHTLNGMPLQAPHGKKMVAKELGVYYGFHSHTAGTTNNDEDAAGYYDRSGKNRRYLWLDTDMRTNFYSIANWNHYHNRGMFEWTMAILIAIAKQTDRILVLPQVFDADMDAGNYFSWTMMDYSKVTEFVDFRETHFISNPKSWRSHQHAASSSDEDWPFDTIVTTGLFQNTRDENGISIYTQVSNQSNIVSQKVWTSSNHHPPALYWLDAWIGALSTTPEFDTAEVLMVNPDLLIGHRHWPFEEQLVNKRNRNDEEGMSLMGKQVLEIYAKLGWCWGEAFRHTANKVSASDSCYGIGTPNQRFQNND